MMRVKFTHSLHIPSFVDQPQVDFCSFIRPFFSLILVFITVGPLKPRALHTVSFYFNQLQNQGSTHQKNYLQYTRTLLSKNLCCFFALSIKRIPKKCYQTSVHVPVFLPQTQAKCQLLHSSKTGKLLLGQSKFMFTFCFVPSNTAQRVQV